MFFATASGPQTLPITGSLLRSICRVRSGDTAFQRVAAVVAAEERAARRSRAACAMCGQMMSGESQFQRSGALALVLLRLDADALAGALVEADEDAVLQLGVDDVRILGIDARHEAVAALRDEPVVVDDAVLRCACATGRRACSCPACRRRRCRTARRCRRRRRRTASPAGSSKKLPGGAAVEALVEAAVAADQQVARCWPGSIQMTWLSTCMLRSPSGAQRLAAVVATPGR